MIHDKKYRVTTYMKPGQLVIFDNQRILHARGEVVSPGVGRWVQGCYVNRDGLWYRWSRRAAQLPSFTSMKSATKEDFVHMGEVYKKEVDNEMVNNFLKMLEAQSGKMLGQSVDLKEHALQTASRAFRDNQSSDIVVMSLFHDMTESIASKNHGHAAAGFLEPYVSPKAIWMLKHHEVFQGYYYYHHFGTRKT